MLRIGDGTKLAAPGSVVPARFGGWLESFRYGSGLLVQLPGPRLTGLPLLSVGVTAVKPSGTWAMGLKVELGWVVWPLPVKLPGPVKLSSRFCGQDRSCRPDAGSNVQGPPVQPSLAIRNPMPSWKGVPGMFPKAKERPSNTSLKTSFDALETGQFAPAAELPVPIVHSSVKSLHADWPLRISPLCTRHIDVAKEVPATRWV